MHPIQQHIIHQLILHRQCRYRDIKPKDVEGNLFMYHLRQLFKEDFVKKTDSGYRLTTKGLQLADNLSLKNLRPRIQPKIVTLSAIQNDRGEWLLYRRSRQPFFGLVGFPYGKIHLGEKIQIAAERELKEKTGLMAELRHAGDVYLTVFQQEELLTQMFCHVFVGRNPTGSLKTETDIGECFWQKIDPKNSDYMPGFVEIAELIKQKNRFFDELSCTL